MDEELVVGPGSDDFGDRLTYLVRRIHGALSQQLDDDLRGAGITQAQLSALAQLDVARPRPMSGAELAVRAGVTAQSMSTAVVGLLERGLVTRRQSPDHGRKLDVAVTDDGIMLLRGIQRHTRETESDLDLGLDAEEREVLIRLLRKMMRALGLFLPEVGHEADA